MELPILERSTPHHGTSGPASARGAKGEAKAETSFSDLMKHRKEVAKLATSGERARDPLPPAEATQADSTGSPDVTHAEDERRSTTTSRPSEGDRSTPVAAAGEAGDGEEQEHVSQQGQQEQHEQEVSHQAVSEDVLETVPPSSRKVGPEIASHAAIAPEESGEPTEVDGERVEAERSGAEQPTERERTDHGVETEPKHPKEQAETRPRQAEYSPARNTPRDPRAGEARKASEDETPPLPEDQTQDQTLKSPAAAEAAVSGDDTAQSPLEFPVDTTATPPSGASDEVAQNKPERPAASPSKTVSPAELAQQTNEPTGESPGGAETTTPDDSASETRVDETPRPPARETAEADHTGQVLADAAADTGAEQTDELPEKTGATETSTAASEMTVMSDEVVQQATDKEARKRTDSPTIGRYASGGRGVTNRLSNPTMPKMSAISGGEGAVETEADELSTPRQLTGPAAQEHERELPELRGPADQTPRGSNSVERTAEEQLTSGAGRTDNGRELSQLEQARLVQRAARAIQAAPQRGGMVRLRLHPPELGSLRVEIHMKKEGLSARLEAETQTARNVLLENLPQLRDRLAEQGIRVEQFDVNVTQQDGDQTRGQAGQTHDSPGERRESSPEESSRDEPRDEQSISDENITILGQQELNVIV
ncbi:MAG: flagellar hook-length control protein FliK [Planctomycetota bacterium]